MRSIPELLTLARQRLTPSGSVAERAATSGAWALASNVLGRGLQLVKLVVLANFLSQRAFGVVSLGLLLLLAFRRFTNLGIRQALVQRPEDDIDAALDTAWLMRGVRGLLVTTVVFLAAPLLADVFAEPGNRELLTNVIRVIGVVPTLRGFGNPGIIYFQKELAFHKEFVYRVGRAAADATVAVGAVLVLGNVWAMVLGAVVGGVAQFGLSYAVHPYRPSFSFDLDEARDLVGYGKWITVSGAAAFLTTEGDDAFVGWLLGLGALGLYQTAYRFSNAPATEITQVVSSVVFPTYSQLQAESDALRTAYFRTVQLTTFAAFPAAVGIAVVAPTFVDAFINNEEGWDLALLVAAMQVLAAWGLLRSLGATTGPLFNAVDRPDLGTKIQLGKLAIIAVAIYPATEAFGVLGTAAVIVGTSLCFSEPVATVLAVRIVDGDYARFLRLLAFPVAGSAVMAAAVLGTQAALSGVSPIPTFVLLVLVGVGSYAAVMAGLTQAGYDIDRVLRKTIGDVVS
jgi:PST family polysaccharide transporter/lipopolysaccharide exporter